MDKKPLRHIEVTIKIGADSWQSLQSSLDSIAFYCEEKNGRLNNMVSGSPSSGFTVDVKVNPDATADSYQKDLKDYIERIRSSED